MNRSCFVILVAQLIAAFLSPRAWAQAQIVKQRAEQIRDNNNQQQGVVNSSGPAAAPNSYNAGNQTQALPDAPTVSPEQLKLINRLATDCAAVKTGIGATPEQKSALGADVAALSKVATKPSKETLNRLSEDLAVALSEKEFSARDLQMLSLQINVLMNCSTLKGPAAQSYVLKADSLLRTGGVSAPAVQALTRDLTGLVNALQKDKPKLYQ